VWELDDAVLPTFALTPEGWFSRLGQVFGMQDIGLRRRAGVLEGLRLKGPKRDRESAHCSLQRFDNSSRVTLGQQVAGGGRFLFWWRDSDCRRPEQLDEWLELGDQVRRRFFKR